MQDLNDLELVAEEEKTPQNIDVNQKSSSEKEEEVKLVAEGG